MPDALDPAAVEAAAESVKRSRYYKLGPRAEARHAITAYLSRAAQPSPIEGSVEEQVAVAVRSIQRLTAELAEARASLEQKHKALLLVEKALSGAVARAENAEQKAVVLYNAAAREAARAEAAERERDTEAMLRKQDEGALEELSDRTEAAERERDHAVEVRERANAATLRAEAERDQAEDDAQYERARAERLEADLAKAREAFEKIADPDGVPGADAYALRRVAREALAGSPGKENNTS